MKPEFIRQERWTLFLMNVREAELTSEEEFVKASCKDVRCHISAQQT